MILIGHGKTLQILDWTLLLDHCDFSAEVGMFNKKLKFKVLVSHRSGAVAALERPKDVTEHMVRFVCDMLVCLCVLKCQNEPAEIALQNAVVSQPSKRWRNRSVKRCFKCTLITTATVTSFPRICRCLLDGETCYVDAHTVCAILQVDEQGLPR